MHKIYGLWIGLAALAFSVNAQSVKLAWDAPAVAPPGVMYRLYAHTNLLSDTASLAAAAVKLNVGTNQTASVEKMAVGTWYFAATAVLNGVESAPSAVVPVQVLPAPPNMRTVVVQYGAITNFNDTGFFWVKLP